MHQATRGCAVEPQTRLTGNRGLAAARQLLFLRLVQHRERIVAGVGGAIATAVDVTTLVLLVHAGVAVAPAAFLGSSMGAVACFVWNKRVAFRDRSRITWQQLVRFGLVAVATALLMAFAM